MRPRTRRAVRRPSISICRSTERPASCAKTFSRAGLLSIPPSASRLAATQLARLRLRYLDCGRRDEYNLDIGARVVAERIRGLGLEVRHEEFDDDHRNVGYRYETSLPALAAVLDQE